MAREKSELKSGMGKAMETFLALVEQVEDCGGSDEHIRRITTDETLRRKLANLIVYNHEEKVDHFGFDD